MYTLRVGFLGCLLYVKQSIPNIKVCSGELSQAFCNHCRDLELNPIAQMYQCMVKPWGASYISIMDRIIEPLEY